MAGLLPDARLPLRAVAVPFAQQDGTSVVALTMALDARAVAAHAPDGVEIAIHAFDPEGRPQGTFTQRAPWREVDGWHELTSVLPFPAGRYALRISAAPVGAPVAGSVYLSVCCRLCRRRDGRGGLPIGSG